MIEFWADAVEGRNDIGFEPGHEHLVKFTHVARQVPLRRLLHEKARHSPLY